MGCKIFCNHPLNVVIGLGLFFLNGIVSKVILYPSIMVAVIQLHMVRGGTSTYSCIW